jgi:anaerobic dimethyl sulfoxide reductase subunit A
MSNPTGLFNVRIKNGAIVCSEPATQVVNQGIAREDAALTTNQILAGHIQTRGSTQNYVGNKYLNDPTRVLYPMQRVGTRATTNGQFVRITWPQAIQTTATWLQNCLSTYGPYSLYSSFMEAQQFSLASYLGLGVVGWGDVSYGPEDFASWYMMAHGSASVDGSGSSGERAPSLFASKLIVLWSLDPTHTPREAVWYYRMAREQGIPVISIDIKYTIKDDVLASQTILIRPGTDSAMMLAVAYVLINESLYNKAYVTANVEPTGFQKFSDYVMGVSDGVAKTPTWAQSITGVPAATIQAFAELYGKSSPTYLFFGPGGCRKFHGEDQARLAVILQTMTGNIGVLGGSCTFDGTIPFGTAFDRPTAPSVNYGTVAGTYTAPSLMMSYMWPYAINMYSLYQSGKLTAQQYANAIGNVPSNPIPNIHMIWTAADSINQTPNINSQMVAIAAVDHLVVQAQHWNPTAQLADLVLPIAEHYEYNEGFVSNNTGTVVYCPPLVKPQGEAVNPRWLYSQLATALGFGAKYWPAFQSTWSNQDVEDAVAALYASAWATWSTTAAATTLYPNGVPSWTTFLQNPVMRQDTTVPAAVPFVANITGGTKFGTASGKIEFYNSYFASTDLTTTKWVGPISALPIYESMSEGFYDPGLNTYPLVLLDTHNRHHTHSFQDANPFLKGEIFRHGLWISVADAKARGIKDNDMVTVSNAKGQMMVPAYVSQRIVPGVVYIHDGAWFNPNAKGVDIGGGPNTLMDGAFNPNGEDPHNVLVNVALSTGGS